MRLTQKIQVFPSPEQKKILWSLSNQCRHLYNLALAERREAYCRGEKITYQTQQNELVLLKRQYPEFIMVYSKVLQMTLNTLDCDYRSFFTLRRHGNVAVKPPHFKSKDYFTTMVFNQSGFKIERGCLKLSHKHPSGVPLCFAVPESFAFGRVFQVTVFQDGRGRYFVSVVYEAKVLPYVDNGLYQAFDVGVVKYVAVNSFGRFVEFKNSRHDRFWNPVVDLLQSRRDHCKRKSHKWHHWNKAFKKSKRKCAMQTRDFQHKLSRKIVENTKANTIVVGNLNVKGMAHSSKAFSRLNRSTQNNGFLSRFVRFLSYKCELAGKRVVEIDESNTSKHCYACGKLHDMPLWMSTMRCDCGNVVDRDKNSAVNVMVRFLSQLALWTGYSRFRNNLRKTGLPTPRLEVHSQEALCASVGIVH